MQGYIQDVKNLFISDKSSDSFASHFASLIPEGTVKKNVKDFVKIKVDILWQGDPLSCLPTFGTRTCKLCAKEWYAIIKLTCMTPHLAINKCTRSMAPAATGRDSTGSTTQRIPTPALMSP
jgi:hypothetical protein